MTIRSEKVWNMIQSYISCNGNITWVEIGVHKGFNPWQVMNRFSNDINKMYLIDPYIPFPEIHEHFKTQEKQDDHKEMAKGRLSCYESKCIWLEEMSDTASLKFTDGSIDILYVDGDHSFDGVLLDIEKYHKKMKKGGLIIFDDWNLPASPTQSPVAQWAAKNDIQEITFPLLLDYPAIRNCFGTIVPNQGFLIL